MLSVCRSEIKSLCGSCKNNVFLFGLRNVCKLVKQNRFCKPNGLMSANSVKKLCSLYRTYKTCASQESFGVAIDALHGSELFEAGEKKQKLIKVAVVGTPNAGKSTFINQLVKRRVCSISSKVHTTRNRAKAIVNEGNTQIIFLDTPGLVNANESKRHNLEKSFLVDAELSMNESDLVVVIHDASNIWTRDRLDIKVLRLLHLYQKKPTVLVLNKVDSIKSKRKLLDLTHVLTCGSLKSNEDGQSCYKSNREKYCKNQAAKDDELLISVKDIDKVLKTETGWAYFENVFMISALKGEGVAAVKECLLEKARTKPWLYPPSVFTDQKLDDLILLAVKEKLLESLPEEIPYNIETELEYANKSPAGDVTAIVLIKCSFKSHAKMLLSSKGRRIRKVAILAEQALESTLMENVRLSLVVQDKK